MDNLETPQTLDDWKAYIAEATEMEKRTGQWKIDAIVEKGRRITEFHAAYKAKGQRWGERWDDACVKVVGLNEQNCSKYMMIARNISLVRETISFPESIESLYFLARTVAADRPTFDEAVSAGEISPKMKREKVESIMRKAEAKGKPRKPNPVKRSYHAERMAAPTYKHLTREEVDPEFTGTPTEFVDKYGHVQALTAEEYATSWFSDWVFNFRELVALAQKQQWREVDHNWLRSPKARDIPRLAEALDYLRPKLAEAEALLARAKLVRGDTSGPVTAGDEELSIGHPADNAPGEGRAVG